MSTLAAFKYYCLQQLNSSHYLQIKNNIIIFIGHGWRGTFDPPFHPFNKFELDIIVGADGRRSAWKGFKGKEFRGKLAIGITVNFMNRNTKEESRFE